MAGSPKLFKDQMQKSLTLKTKFGRIFVSKMSHGTLWNWQMEMWAVRLFQVHLESTCRGWSYVSPGLSSVTTYQNAGNHFMSEMLSSMAQVTPIKQTNKYKTLGYSRH